MLYDPCKNVYKTKRNPVYAGRAMACTSVPLGAQTGIDIMRRGGNAVDAAVAMAAAMPLFEPTGNALGSDAFALVWIERDKRLYGLNASGVEPMSLDAGKIRAMGHAAVPKAGWLSTMVPGAPAGWAALNSSFGTMSLSELFSPAADYARRGVPVAPTVAPQWAADVGRIARAAQRDPEPYRAFFDVFTENGAPYGAGDLFIWEDYAATLDELAATGCESYYRGDIMKKIVAFSDRTGGYFTGDDFINYRPEWVEPITADYRGYTVCEIPPNGHGITVLMALKLLSGLALPENREDEAYYHKVIECIKLAFADVRAYVADPRYMKTRVADLLSSAYADRRRALVGERALMPERGDPRCGGTIYLCTADPEGNMVSYIQSNYNTFGSGIVIPGTGISLQDRAANFSLDENSDNCLRGGKKSYHTIIPGFLMRGGEAVGPFGVMGAFMQPQGQVEVLVNAIDYHMNPQEAIDAPRIQWTGDRHVQLERSAGEDIASRLAARGHEVEMIDDPINMGRAQMIWKTENGCYIGGTESRCDGQAAVW